MIESATRSACVKTLIESRLCAVRKADFERLVLESPEFAQHVIRKLSERVRALTNNVRSLALLDVYGRVARLFLELAERKDGLSVVSGKLSQQDIASRVGASRSMINRILKDLARGGYITVKRREIVIHSTLPKRW